jgi:hypothetical protein
VSGQWRDLVSLAGSGSRPHVASVLTLDEHLSKWPQSSRAVDVAHENGAPASRCNMIPFWVAQRQGGQWYISFDVIVQKSLPFGAPLTTANVGGSEWRESPAAVKSLDELPRLMRAMSVALFEWMAAYLAGGPLPPSYASLRVPANTIGLE